MRKIILESYRIYIIWIYISICYRYTCSQKGWYKKTSSKKRYPYIQMLVISVELCQELCETNLTGTLISLRCKRPTPCTRILWKHNEVCVHALSKQEKNEISISPLCWGHTSNYTKIVGIWSSFLNVRSSTKIRRQKTSAWSIDNTQESHKNRYFVVHAAKPEQLLIIDPFSDIDRKSWIPPRTSAVSNACRTCEGP